MARPLSSWLLAACVLLVLAPGAARAADIEVWSGRAMRPVLEALKDEMQQAAGMTVGIRSATARIVRNHAGHDGPVEIIILSRSLIDELVTQKRVDPGSVIDIARVRLGIGLRAGTVHPELTSAAAFRQFLLEAKTIVCPDPRIGAISGASFANTLKQAGLTDALGPKIKFVRDPHTADYVARGEADIAVQPVSQLLAVPGIEAIPFPAEIRPDPIVLTAAIATTARHRRAARAIVDLLSSAKGSAIMRANHLDPG